jgi:hypothetical protein
LHPLSKRGAALQKGLRLKFLLFLKDGKNIKEDLEVRQKVMKKKISNF